ncbi:MAG: HD-GYP domain-containing protein, partial [Candidatus Omnitrophica bacterium]|nr:HD-GYP domain-containing protein [Candidatus Omnitrophota bacterium]
LLARKIGMILLLVMIFALFFAWFVAKGITNPLRVLTNAVHEFGKGVLTKKVEIKTRDELEDLAVAFNNMTAQIKEGRDKLQRHYLGTIRSLAQALEAKDPYTMGHSERVTHYALDIARHIGVSEEDMNILKEVCLFHDIGKIGIPEKILSKTGPLTEEERHVIEMHPKIGEDILKFVEFLKPGLPIVRDHHERPDGKGYPHGLKGKEIPLLASIVSVADVFDAITTDRPYRKALPKEVAIKILEENRGTQFDPYVVDVFVGYLKENK